MFSIKLARYSCAGGGACNRFRCCVYGGNDVRCCFDEIAKKQRETRGNSTKKSVMWKPEFGVNVIVIARDGAEGFVFRNRIYEISYALLRRDDSTLKC